MSNPLINGPVTEDVLQAHQCLEAVDRVSGDPEMTQFKQTARLLQALWREEQGIAIGSQPMRPTEGKPSRPLGSRIDLEFARSTGVNFLSESVRREVQKRISDPQPHQTLDEDRLSCDLLSSMPMCFNLFGELASDLSLADRAVHTWWPDTPGRVSSVRFEWSPGRRLSGEYLENRSAFDVAFIIGLEDGTQGVLGIETKYHEHAKSESPPSEERITRYAEVTSESGIMSRPAVESILGTELQQIWLDHLLAVSMPLHASGRWTWAKFVLVHPQKNSSYAHIAEQYRALLTKPETFEVRTIESLLDASVLPKELSAAFRSRYLW